MLGWPVDPEATLGAPETIVGDAVAGEDVERCRWDVELRAWRLGSRRAPAGLFGASTVMAGSAEVVSPGEPDAVWSSANTVCGSADISTKPAASLSNPRHILRPSPYRSCYHAVTVAHRLTILLNAHTI
jgi:hypothetical protein